MELHTLSNVYSWWLVITLCVYAQQGYAFGCVSLCMYVRMYMWPKNWLFLVLPLENLPLV